jgi:transcriptional regulator of acetoin/glycerol metabolism
MLRTRMENTEREAILNALRQADGNKSEAARLLGIQRSVLYKKLDRMMAASR